MTEPTRPACIDVIVPPTVRMRVWSDADGVVQHTTGRRFRVFAPPDITLYMMGLPADPELSGDALLDIYGSHNTRPVAFTVTPDGEAVLMPSDTPPPHSFSSDPEVAATRERIRAASQARKARAAAEAQPSVTPPGPAETAPLQDGPPAPVWTAEPETVMTDHDFTDGEGNFDNAGIAEHYAAMGAAPVGQPDFAADPWPDEGSVPEYNDDESLIGYEEPIGPADDEVPVYRSGVGEAVGAMCVQGQAPRLSQQAGRVEVYARAGSRLIVVGVPAGGRSDEKSLAAWYDNTPEARVVAFKVDADLNAASDPATVAALERAITREGAVLPETLGAEVDWACALAASETSRARQLSREAVDGRDIASHIKAAGEFPHAIRAATGLIYLQLPLEPGSGQVFVEAPERAPGHVIDYSAEGLAPVAFAPVGCSYVVAPDVSGWQLRVGGGVLRLPSSEAARVFGGGRVADRLAVHIDLPRRVTAQKPPAGAGYRSPRAGAMSLHNWQARGLAGQMWLHELLEAAAEPGGEKQPPELEQLGVALAINMFRKHMPISKSSYDRLLAAVEALDERMDDVRVFDVEGETFFARARGGSIRLVGPGGREVKSDHVRKVVAESYGLDPASAFDVLQSAAPMSAVRWPDSASTLARLRRDEREWQASKRGRRGGGPGA
jgi:hypothetical protein